MDEKHCVSLELSKKLKEAKFPQKGEFWWSLYLEVPSEGWKLMQFHDNKDCEYVVAPLASELIDDMKHIQGFTLPYWSESENAWIENRDASRIHSDTFCNALAKQRINYYRKRQD